jgi:organic radical activating enzyme
MNQISTDREGMIPEKYMDFKWYARGGSPVNPAIVARREIYDMVGGFKLDDQCGMDSEWDVRANLAGARWAYIDEPLYYYRKHPGQTVIQRSFEWYMGQQRSFLDGAAPLWNSQFNPRRHIEVMVTGKCNKKCQHCSQASYNKLHCDYDYPMELIEKLCKRSLENGARYEWLQFSGGEPLLWENLEEACKYAKESGAFKKVRIMSNCFDKERLAKVLDEHIVDMVYTDTYNTDRGGLEMIKSRYAGVSTMADIPHKPLPIEPLDGTLPARCTCDRPSVIGNNVYPCGNFYEHVTRLGKNMDDYRKNFCTLDDDWISFYRKADRFNMDVCKYCLSNWRVWEKVPYPENTCVGV